MKKQKTSHLNEKIVDLIDLITRKSKNIRNKLSKVIRHLREKYKIYLAALIILALVSIFGSFLYKNYFKIYSYELGRSGGLVAPINSANAAKVKFDNDKKAFQFNNGQSFASAENIKTGSGNVSSTIYEDSSKGIAVNDSVNNISFRLSPKYSLKSGKQSQNRVIFPLVNSDGWLVDTFQNTGIKEDIVLLSSSSNEQSFEYYLNVGDNLEARLESNGSIGVYGNTLLSGNITTGTDKDAALLQKARQNAEKNTRLFVIPKPVVIELNGHKSEVTAMYKLNGNHLSIEVTGLDKGRFPLSIDPSVYVATAQQFMNGNNETNINFNVEEQLIEKGRTTGARFDEWLTTTSLPTASWGSANAVAGGFVYSLGGTSFSGKIYNSQGAGTFTVPSGVSSITVKVWGGGGGGGAGGSAAAGGAGGGGGYVNATIPVTAGETLNLYVGGGGGAGTRNTAGGGGGGGGYSSVYRSTTPLVIAAGGGGGGGGRATASHTGGYGGAGGGTTGQSGGNAGGTSGAVTGGGGGTPSSGGTAGTGGLNVGTNGSALNGGLGANGRNSSGADGGAANKGLATGGAGGSVTTTTYAAGGGGGAGWYGGGGGSASNGTTITRGGSGGGGGSSYTNPTYATEIENTAGSGSTPGNSGDSNRYGASDGGTAGAIGGVGTAGDSGIVIITYGVSGGTSVSQSVNWSKFNTTDGTIESANPGSGTCSGWCTTSAYDMPDERTNFSLVAYNGFLYAIGGQDSSGTRQNNVYIAKLGANGEPQLWHPTNTDKSTWSYWYQDTGLSSIRSDFAAVAYNNRMYILGGISTSGPVNTVEYADITATGLLSTWTGGTNLPYNLYGHSAQIYNDRLYIIGGSSSVGGAPLSSVYYNILNNNGSMNSWASTTPMITGRLSTGGNFSVIWGAYIYVSGGCSAVNASGYCTSILSDTQVSSINADGSIDVWNTVGGVSSQRTGSGLVAWRDRLYEIGGCSSQNTTTGDCNTAMLSDIIYGVINQDGDASTVSQSAASGVSPCSGTDPYGCNLPGTTYIGNMLSVTVITNGYLYVIGGCTNDTCSSTLGNVAYVAISSTGQMTKPTTCPTGTYRGNTWCVDTTNTISGGIAAGSPVVFGGNLYIIGGLNGSSNTNTINRTTLNGDGSISAWAATQSLTGLSMTSVSYTYAYARANPASAGSVPGNLFVFGGCSTSSAAGCTAYSQRVYKCDIQSAGTIANCNYNTQLQIGTIPGDSSPGLGIMSGTVYANYIYLIGGVSPNLVDLDTVRYAKFDNNNNVVAVSGSSWIESPSKMAVGRRRSDAFGYNGYIYVIGGYDATEGVLPDIEFIKVDVSDGSIGDDSGFQVSSVTINHRWGLSVPVSNSYAYVIGGCTTGSSPSGCTARTDVIQTFQVYNNDSGAPAGFANSANTYSTNPDRVGSSSAILNGYIYVAGGCISSTDCTTATNNVSYAAIDAYGNIGTWYNTTANLPDVRAWGELETAGGSLYYIGGQSSTSTDEKSEVYYATPSSGNITSWNTASNGLPAARTKFGSTVWNNRLYVVGGLDGNAADTSTVYVSPQLNSGGNITSAWSTSSTSFQVNRSRLTAIAYANNLYLFGGYDGSNYLSDVQYSQINSSSGDAGTWTFSTNLHNPLADADGFAANGYIYLMGGRSADTSCEPVTMVSPISANTTIATGNNPTGIGAWYETNQRYTGNRYGASAAYYDGKAYVIGGGDCSPKLTTQTISSSGSGSFTVPEGVTSLTVKLWGGGAGGGAGGTSSGGAGGAGGGAGYVSATISVTPGETLSTYVGGAGSGGSVNTSGGGGGGGGYSSIYRSTTPLVIAAGGGGGGGGKTATSSNSGGAGGAGGGTTGVAGSAAGGTSTANNGGGAGTPSAGGTTGTGGTNIGTNGSSLTGGLGGDGRNAAGNDGSGASGGVATGGNGGSVVTTTYAGGGGGGAGYYGGAGGNGSNSTRGGSGGGGGSSYTNSSYVTMLSNTAGSGTSPGNSGDSDRGTAGNGGSGGTSGNAGSSGNNGLIVLSYYVPLTYPATVIQQTTLLSQPQVAKYSIMIDTDSDVFPNYWLLNGVDNSIGAKWKLKYRSMTNTTTTCTSPAMTTWGSDTDFGDVTLGQYRQYIPVNGSGISTDCARFYDFVVTVDSSQAFGYPDDVSRGPTITDLTLQFTADPSKRLMHGRTFVGGLQMPDDTPYYQY